MYYVGRIVTRAADTHTKTTVYITDESVKPIKQSNIPIHKLHEQGYEIVSSFGQGGNSYLLLEKE